MLGISEHETKVVTDVVQKLLYGTRLLPDTTKQLLQTVVIDESYHALVAHDFIQQVKALTGEKPLLFPKGSDLEFALSETQQDLPQSMHDLFSLVAVCIAENLITQELLASQTDPNVNPFFYEINCDHLTDEGRHSKIFTGLIDLIWSDASVTEKEIILDKLPSFIERWMKRVVSLESDRVILRSLDFTEQQIEMIIYDTFPDLNFETAAYVNPNIPHIEKWLRSVGVWQYQESLWESQSRKKLMKTEAHQLSFLERIVPSDFGSQWIVQETTIQGGLKIADAVVMFLTYLSDVLQVESLAYQLARQTSDGKILTSNRLFEIADHHVQGIDWFKKISSEWEQKFCDSYAASENLSSRILICIDCKVETGFDPQRITVQWITEDVLKLRVGYHSSQYKDARITDLLSDFSSYVEFILLHPTSTLASLPLTKIQSTNIKQDSYSKEPSRTVCELLAESIQQHQDRIAIRTLPLNLTYRELDKRLSAFSAALLKAGFNHGSRVGVCVSNRLDYVCLILGIMKAGMTAVPLPSGMQTAYLSDILEQARVPLIVSDEENANLFSMRTPSKSTLQVWLCCEGIFEGETLETVLAKPEDAACILFTSGTTGVPKGVVLLHGAIAAFARGAKASFPLHSDDVILYFSSLSFDASLAELVNAIASGATLALPSRNIMDSPAHFFRECVDLGVTVLNLPAAYWAQLLQETWELPLNIRMILVYGESLNMSGLDRWYQKKRKAVLINTYGPTEATIGTSFCHLDLYSSLRNKHQLIGRPFPGRRVLILDPFQRPLPLGAIGEICIEGFVAQTFYLGDQDSPLIPVFQDCAQLGKLYRTGDFGRWIVCSDDADPVLVFHGRRDRQVKISGSRVELDSIEKTLMQHTGVAEALILVRNQENATTLAAFVLAKPDKDISEFELRHFLKKELPSYCCPSSLRIREQWPLTSRGKVDKAALLRSLIQPKTEGSDHSSTSYELAKIWQSLLGALSVDEASHFFKLGGHSLLAMTLVGKINERWQVGLTLRQVIESPTFADMNRWLELTLKSKERTPTHEDQRVVQQSEALSYGQEAMLLIDRMCLGNSIHYNFAFTISLSRMVDKQAMQLALNSIVNRHDALRTVFSYEGVKATQKVVPLIFELKSELATREGFQKIAEEDARTPFQLAKAPPLRVRYFEITDSPESILYFNLHHILHDGISIHILIEELLQSYQQFQDNGQITLAPLKATYRDFACAVRQKMEASQHEFSLFWKKYLQNTKPLVLPIRKKGRGDPFDAVSHTLFFEERPLERLRQRCLDEGVSLFAALFSGVLLAFRQISEQEDFTVASVMSLREDEAYMGVIGLFVNTVLLRGAVRSESTIRECIFQNHQSILNAMTYRHFPFIMLIDKLKLPREHEEQKIFDVMINYHPFRNLSKPYDSGGLPHKVQLVDNKTSNVGLGIDISPWGDSMEIRLGYSRNIYESEKIADLGRKIKIHLENLSLCDWSRTFKEDILY
jgi:amino acid adenylation domain-containing protein